MTEKNIKKLLASLGVPEEQQKVIIEKASKDDEEWDVNDVLEAAKKWAEPLLKPGIEQSARKAGASGAILKVLKSVYDSTKEDGQSFEDWQKSVEGKDYADVVTESITSARTKGVSQEQAVKELQDKLTKAMQANQEAQTNIAKVNADWQAKFDARELADLTNARLASLPQKPLKPTAYKYFLAELAEGGIEVKLHEGAPALFKQGEVTPLQNEKGTAIVKLEDKFTEWATENPGLFVQSGGGHGGAGGGGTDDPPPGKHVKIDEQKGVKIVGDNRPVPLG